MFPAPWAAFARTELHFLQRRDWALWRHVIKERPTGLPLPSLFYPRSSSNAIHHAYHLSRFEVETGRNIREFEMILEFGGGYGSLCRIAHGAGFAGEYVIFDLPEQSALQRYYLGRVGIPNVTTISTLEELADLENLSEKPKMFIATWSLSESPLKVRRQIAEALRGFDAFLIAYQTQFEGVENEPFFHEWQSWFPHVKWKNCPIKHLPASSYLFGVRVLHTGL